MGAQPVRIRDHVAAARGLESLGGRRRPASVEANGRRASPEARPTSIGAAWRCTPPRSACRGSSAAHHARRKLRGTTSSIPPSAAVREAQRPPRRPRLRRGQPLRRALQRATARPRSERRGRPGVPAEGRPRGMHAARGASDVVEAGTPEATFGSGARHLLVAVDGRRVDATKDLRVGPSASTAQTATAAANQCVRGARDVVTPPISASGTVAQPSATTLSIVSLERFPRRSAARVVVCEKRLAGLGRTIWARSAL